MTECILILTMCVVIHENDVKPELKCGSVLNENLNITKHQVLTGIRNEK